MPGGINISQAVGAAISGGEVIDMVTGRLRPSPNAPPTPKIWRPPQWNKPATYMLTVQSTEGLVDTTPQRLDVNSDGVPTLRVNPVATTLYVFDAVLRARHNSRLQITEHPVQLGANISDHAYLLPRQITLEIKMSDAMDSYAADMWTGSTSKSVAAYQTLMRLQEERAFMSLTTRLFTYDNVMIEEVTPEETKDTTKALCCSVTFREIITASVATELISARPQATDTTQLATKQAQDVPAAVTQQYKVTPPSDPTVPGAGFWTSLGNSLAELVGQ